MTLAIQMFDTHCCGRMRTSVGLRHWDSAGGARRGRCVERKVVRERVGENGQWMGVTRVPYNSSSCSLGDTVSSVLITCRIMAYILE